MTAARVHGCACSGQHALKKCALDALSNGLRGSSPGGPGQVQKQDRGPGTHEHRGQVALQPPLPRQRQVAAHRRGVAHVRAWAKGRAQPLSLLRSAAVSPLWPCACSCLRLTAAGMTDHPNTPALWTIHGLSIGPVCTEYLHLARTSCLLRSFRSMQLVDLDKVKCGCV